MPEDIQEELDFCPDPPPNRSELSESPGQPRRPDLGLFLGVVGVLLAIFIPILQMNGLEITWEISALSYLLIIIGLVWTFLVHAVPHYGRMVRLAGSFLIAVVSGWLAIIGTHRQYQLQHPIVPLVSIDLHTIPGLPDGITNNPHLRYQQIDIRNYNETEIDNFYARIQLPEPIDTIIETDSTPGVVIEMEPILTKVSIIGNGNRNFLGPHSARHYQHSAAHFFDGNHAQLMGLSDGDERTGAWQLTLNKLPPQGIVSFLFLTSDEGDAKNYISLVNYVFKTNGATLFAVSQGDGKGGVIIHNVTMAFIVHTNKIFLPNEDWHLGTNELRFYSEGLYQYPSAGKLQNAQFLAPFIFETNSRSLAALPTQTGDGKWRRVLIDYQ